MKPGFKLILVFGLSLIFSGGYSQSTCPDNIGFETGSFFKWTCSAGLISGGSVVVSPGPPIDGRHTIIQNTVPQKLDPYGGFPINCPNGSGYSIKLGNDLGGAQAERVSYTFTVPAGKDEYSFIYNYAIVFQNPPHSALEQPRFTSKVFDETEGQYLSCGAFEFVASSGLPGFQVASIGQGVWYKPWSPVTVKLMNCAGKTITIEFTVNDCSLGGHFGYAYLDVNENCTSPITGNVYCNGATSVTLSAPFGFQEYKWYTADFSTLLGTTHTLKLSPIPPVGTRFALEIVPYPGLGCLDTLYTTIEKSIEAFDFHLLDSLTGCYGYPADLTIPIATQGSSPGLKFSYFIDSTGLEYLSSPSYVTSEGVYYVKAENMTGCTETKPIKLNFKELTLVIKDPPDVCFPNTANLTDTSVTSGSEAGTVFTYWKDSYATIPLLNPNAITEGGTYYIKAQNGICNVIAGVNVRIWKANDFVVNPVENCTKVDLTDFAVTAGSSSILKFSQWLDNAATTPVLDASNVTTSGTYYIKATTPSGCSFIKPISVTIKPPPDFTILNPPAVTAPETINLINSIASSRNYQYSYWLNDSATRALTNPTSISQSGTYYVLAKDTFGCFALKPVTVTVIIPPDPVIRFPNTFSPNNDGVNDGFRIDVVGNFTFKTFKIYNRWGQIIFETTDPFKYWYGDLKGKPAPIGTYYWIMELVNNRNQKFYRRTGSITLLR